MGLRPAAGAGAVVGSSGRASAALDVSPALKAVGPCASVCPFALPRHPGIALAFSGSARPGVRLAPGAAGRLLQGGLWDLQP